MLPKSRIIRDRAWLDHLRDGPCVVTGLTYDCEPAHLRLLGSGGAGMKPSDDRALPLHHSLHRRQSTEGEFAVWQWCVEQYPEFLARLLIRDAESRYRQWKGRP